MFHKTGNRQKQFASYARHFRHFLSALESEFYGFGRGRLSLGNDDVLLFSHISVVSRKGMMYSKYC